MTLRLRPPGGSPIWLLRTTGALPLHSRALVLIGMCTTAMCSYSIHNGLVFIHKNSSLLCRHFDLFPLAVDIPRVITLFGTAVRPTPTPNLLPSPSLYVVLFTRSIPSLCRLLVHEQVFNYSIMNSYKESYNFQIFIFACFAHKFHKISKYLDKIKPLYPLQHIEAFFSSPPPQPKQKKISFLFQPVH